MVVLWELKMVKYKHYFDNEKKYIFHYIYSHYQSSVYISPFSIPITPPYDFGEECHSWFNYFQSLGLDSIKLNELYYKKQ